MIDDQEILDERARRLAMVSADTVAATGPGVLEVVTFTLSGERYAIETRYVREIVPLADFTPVPRSPAFLFGVINLRGEVLAVFDLRPVFGLTQGTISDLFRVIVLGNDCPEFGVLAETVHEVTAFPTNALYDLPAAGNHHAYLRGVTAEMLALVDGQLVLNDPLFSVNDGR
ncbi:MAG TPA: chemotaxis protein CheW [Isosphaeraceae bacterium]|nr:chemotaxis protein CheW [Isosphaeraceae bacterium]